MGGTHEAMQALVIDINLFSARDMNKSRSMSHAGSEKILDSEKILSLLLRSLYSDFAISMHFSFEFAFKATKFLFCWGANEISGVGI